MDEKRYQLKLLDEQKEKIQEYLLFLEDSNGIL